MVGTTTGTTIGTTTTRPLDDAIMRILTRLLGEPVGNDAPVTVGHRGIEIQFERNYSDEFPSLPGCAVLLSSSQSDEEAGLIGKSKDQDVVGLIRPVKDLSIWLAEDQVGSIWEHLDTSLDQVKLFSGIRHMMIHVVANGIVMPYLLDRNLETHLPVLPPEVDEVRFRWRAGKRKYRYNFYRLESHDQVAFV